MKEIKKILHALRRKIAKLWLELNPQLKIVGVAGSYGKTNTTVAIYKALSKKMPTVRTDLNLDTNYNLPITILKIKPWTEALVLEMGVDHIGEMDFHLSLVSPKVAVITGITPVHSDKEHLGSIEGIIKEKGKLLESLSEDGLAILNYDDEQVRKMAQLTKAKVIFYGKDREHCDYWFERVSVKTEGSSFDLHTPQRKTFQVKTGLIGGHHTSTCLAAFAVASFLGVSEAEILKALEELTPLSGRISLESGPKGSWLINDARRANPVSTIAGLITLADLPGRKKIAVLGEMGELGSFSEEGHRMVGRKLAELKIDFVIAVGPLTKHLTDEAVKNGLSRNSVFWVKDIQEAALKLGALVKQSDLIYLKGSLLRHMERIIMILEGQEIRCRKGFCHRYQLCHSCPKR